MNTNILSYTFIKFIFVGILNTLFGYSVFSLLFYLGLHYTLAMLLATLLGVLFNFKTIGKLVFNNTQNKLLSKFILVYAIAYLLNIFIIKALTLVLSNIYINGAIAMVITAICSYLMNKNWVFGGEAYETN